jgi:hypothetical protein
MAGLSFGRKLNYGLTVTVSSDEWWQSEGDSTDNWVSPWLSRLLWMG